MDKEITENIETPTKYLKPILEAAREALKSGELKSAVNFYEYAMALDDQNIEALYTIAVLYMKYDNKEVAISCFDRIISQNIENPFVYEYMGIMHDREKRKEYFDNALGLYFNTRLSQKDYIKFINISLKMYEDEDYDIAESYALLAYSIKPSIKVSNILGSIYFKLKDYDKALSYFHDIYAKLPIINVCVVSNIAHCYKEKNSFSIALRYIEKALEMYPRNERLYYDMGLIYLHNNDKLNSIKAFENVSDINPSFSFDIDSIL